MWGAPVAEPPTACPPPWLRRGRGRRGREPRPPAAGPEPGDVHVLILLVLDHLCQVGASQVHLLQPVGPENCLAARLPGCTWRNVPGAESRAGGAGGSSWPGPGTSGVGLPAVARARPPGQVYLQVYNLCLLKVLPLPMYL